MSGADVEAVLRRWRAGEPEAEAELWHALWAELHRIASRHMERQPSSHTLQPTALVSEAWLRLERGHRGAAADREHFLAFASRVMRSVLVDHARRRNAAKRGGGVRDDALDRALTLAWSDDSALEVLALDEALARLEAEDSTLVRVVELRFFGGLSMEEVAHATDVSLSTAERRWRLARMWLREQLADGGTVAP